MDSTPAPKKPPEKDTSGVALFMVLGAVAVLSILVTEFVYISQLSQKVAFDGLDQVKAHYLAKTAFKFSLLRLKGYDKVRGIVGGTGGSGGIPGVPKSMIEMIWQQPVKWPIPTNAPGLTLAQKEGLAKLQKESSLEGDFVSTIQSESSKYNLNMILAPFAPTGATGPTGTTGTNPNTSAGNTGTTAPTGTAQAFNVENARNSLKSYIEGVLTQKMQGDEDFAAEYRDLRIEDLMDNIYAWADRTYEPRTAAARDRSRTMKRAPFYSIQELHMIPGIDDTLYNILEPTLTATYTQGININTMNEGTLKAIVPGMTKEEVTDFFKYRDSREEDHLFKKPDDFYAYLQKAVGIFRNSEEEINKFREGLTKNNIRLITDETQFKIIASGQFGQSVRTIEAFVTLGAKPTRPTTPTPGQPAVTQSPKPDPGLKVNFMRFL